MTQASSSTSNSSSSLSILGSSSADESFFESPGDSDEGFLTAPDDDAVEGTGAVPLGKEFPFLRNSTGPLLLVTWEEETGEFSALVFPAPVRFMLLNMSLTAPTLLEATPAEDGWPAPPPPPATALLPLGEVESLGLSLTWSKLSRPTGLGFGSGLGLGPESCC